MAENTHRVFVETTDETTEDRPDVEGFHDVYVAKQKAWQQCTDANCKAGKDHRIVAPSGRSDPSAALNLGFAGPASGGGRS